MRYPNGTSILRVMTGHTLLGLWALFMSSASFAISEMKLHCASKDLAKKPYLTFDFTINSRGDGPVLASPHKLAIEVSKSDHYGAEKGLTTDNVLGCENATVFVEDLKKSKYAFECDGDGDAGHGYLYIISASRVGHGKIYFPNGKELKSFTIPDRSEFPLVCRIN